MQADNKSTGSNRFIKLTEMNGRYLDEMEIEIRYRGEASVTKAVTLDKEVIPRIMELLNTPFPDIVIH